MTDDLPDEICRGGDSCVICEYEAKRLTYVDPDPDLPPLTDRTSHLDPMDPVLDRAIRALSKFPRKPTPEGTPA